MLRTIESRRRGGIARAAAAAAVGLALAAFVATGCGGDDGDEPMREATVEITDFEYEPADLKVEVGGRVTFVNREKESGHSAKSADLKVSPQPGATRHDGSEINVGTEKGFATHALFPGEPQTVVFKAPGKFTYFCAFHKMQGTVEVVPKGG